MFLTKIPSAGFGIKKTRVKGKHIRTGDSRPNIINALQKVSDEEFLKYVVKDEKMAFESLDVSQTPWIINGVKLAPTSVSECIGEKIRELLRPFFMEIINPRNPFPSQKALNAVQEEINKENLGRTVPNFGDMIGCHADILALDVLEVDLDTEDKDLEHEGFLISHSQTVLLINKFILPGKIWLKL
ncbi:18323_t:CDS:2, partial [Racocetra fulgida]